jgi:hypothetical protein
MHPFLHLKEIYLVTKFLQPKLGDGVTGRVQWLWSQPGTRALLLLLLVLLVMERMQEGMLQKAACNCLEREDCFLAVWFRTWNLQVYCLNE